MAKTLLLPSGIGLKERQHVAIMEWHLKTSFCMGLPMAIGKKMAPAVIHKFLSETGINSAVFEPFFVAL
jgi:hypothetical protein